jgi:hypothetical protein
MDQVSLFKLKNKKCFYGLVPRPGREDVLRISTSMGVIHYSSKYDEKSLKFDFILLKDKIDLIPAFIKRITVLRKQVLVDLSSISLSPQTLSKLRVLIRKNVKLTMVFNNSVVYSEGVQIINYVFKSLGMPVCNYFDKLFQDV